VANARSANPDILAAIDLADSAQISFWDAMILRSASEMGCTTLWTEDLNAGQVVAGVRIVDPFACSRNYCGHTTDLREPRPPTASAPSTCPSITHDR